MRPLLEDLIITDETLGIGDETQNVNETIHSNG
jgi:hypothetical protein